MELLASSLLLANERITTPEQWMGAIVKKGLSLDLVDDAEFRVSLEHVYSSQLGQGRSMLILQ